MRFPIAILASVALACGPLPEEDAETDSPENERAVDYTLECRSVTCHGADDKSTYNNDGYQSVTCTWHCATYEGRKEQWVQLDFVLTTGQDCVRLESEFVSSGVCD